MRTWLKWLNVVWLWAMVPALYAGNTPREVLNLNPSWKYSRGDDAGAARPAYDDSAWERVGLPHSFSIPYFMSKDFYVGYGWYRREVDLTAKQLKKKIFLEFDGVFQEAEVFVNGVRAGSHVGGYTGFSIDITPQARKGRNVIAVRVNNLWHPDRAPRAGEHVFSGGIYRNVRLVLKSPAYIDWYGTSVTTPDLAQNDGRSSTVRVVTDLCNAIGSEATFRLQTDVIDAKGRTVASVTDDYKIASGASVQADQTTPTVEQPICWSPEQPYLYKVVSTLSRKGRMLDRTETVLGFRWMEWTADKGFFLNGKHLYLRGANVHQDHAGWGDAVTRRAYDERSRIQLHSRLPLSAFPGFCRGLRPRGHALLVGKCLLGHRRFPGGRVLECQCLSGGSRRSCRIRPQCENAVGRDDTNPSQPSFYYCVEHV